MKWQISSPYLPIYATWKMPLGRSDTSALFGCPWSVSFLSILSASTVLQNQRWVFSYPFNGRSIWHMSIRIRFHHGYWRFPNHTSSQQERNEKLLDFWLLDCLAAKKCAMITCLPLLLGANLSFVAIIQMYSRYISHIQYDLGVS